MCEGVGGLEGGGAGRRGSGGRARRVLPWPFRRRLPLATFNGWLVVVENDVQLSSSVASSSRPAVSVVARTSLRHPLAFSLPPIAPVRISLVPRPRRMAAIRWALSSRVVVPVVTRSTMLVRIRPRARLPSVPVPAPAPTPTPAIPRHLRSVIPTRPRPRAPAPTPSIVPLVVSPSCVPPVSRSVRRDVSLTPQRCPTPLSLIRPILLLPIYFMTPLLPSLVRLERAALGLRGDLGGQVSSRRLRGNRGGRSRVLLGDRRERRLEGDAGERSREGRRRWTRRRRGAWGGEGEAGVGSRWRRDGWDRARKGGSRYRVLDGAVPWCSSRRLLGRALHRQDLGVIPRGLRGSSGNHRAFDGRSLEPKRDFGACWGCRGGPEGRNRAGGGGEGGGSVSFVGRASRGRELDLEFCWRWKRGGAGLGETRRRGGSLRLLYFAFLGLRHVSIHG